MLAVGLLENLGGLVEIVDAAIRLHQTDFRVQIVRRDTQGFAIIRNRIRKLARRRSPATLLYDVTAACRPSPRRAPRRLMRSHASAVVESTLSATHTVTNANLRRKMSASRVPLTPETQKHSRIITSGIDSDRFGNARRVQKPPFSLDSHHAENYKQRRHHKHPSTANDSGKRVSIQIFAATTRGINHHHAPEENSSVVADCSVALALARQRAIQTQSYH